MAEIKQYIFSYKEVAEALVRKLDIHDGLWGIYMEFGIRAANIGSTDDDLLPAAVVPVVKVGLQRFKSENSLVVDASKVNPEGKRLPKKKSSKKRARKK
ncbi:hypothetical protein MYX84_00800 [Acidobacteria bacterium AH-259-O06]|nr:hypothetical protein [Acidobacteria bacterium AH-259-O06]